MGVGIVLNRTLLSVSILSLLCSNYAFAENRYSCDPICKREISVYEQQIGQHVLFPSWLPPKYEQVNIRYSGMKRLDITFAREPRRDGSIGLQVERERQIRDTHLSKIKLEDGTLAYFKEERLEDAFDNVPFDDDYVRLYFYDSGLLYTLGMGSKVISTMKMKQIIIKVANSMLIAKQTS